MFEGLNIVIDGGPYSATAENPVLQYMEQHAHHSAVIDVLMVTHPHIDHYAGAEALTRHFEIVDYFDPYSGLALTMPATTTSITTKFGACQPRGARP